jgi:hypothetical protein
MLKWVGWVGTGRHSRSEFDIVIEDLGRPPAANDPLSADSRPIVHAFLSEDVEPQEGLGIEIAGHVLEPDPAQAGAKWRLRRV